MHWVASNILSPHNIYLCIRYNLQRNVTLLDRVRNFWVELNSKMRIIKGRYKKLSWIN